MVVITAGLVGFYYLTSKDYWLFSVSALIGWTVANWVYDQFNLHPSTNTIDFAIYIFAIVLASAAGAWVVQQLIGLVVTNSAPSQTHPFDLITVGAFSALTAVITYLVPNFEGIWERAHDDSTY